LVKVLKAFRVYVLNSKIIAYVPSASVKEIFIQPNINGKISKWISKILEFDLEIKPTKLVKGKGLAKLLAESNLKRWGLTSSTLAHKFNRMSCLKETLHCQNAPSIEILYIFC
jgi:hypothetical protein